MKAIQRMFSILILMALLASSLAVNPKPAQAQTPAPEKLAVFESFSWVT